jgi:hypothetical protein
MEKGVLNTWGKLSKDIKQDPGTFMSEKLQSTPKGDTSSKKKSDGNMC